MTRPAVVRLTLRPSAEEDVRLRRHVGAQRAFFNAALAAWVVRLKKKRVDPDATLPWGHNDLVNFTNAVVKADPELSWYCEVNAVTRTVAAEHLSDALARWSRSKRQGGTSKVRFPRFKKKSGRDTATFKQNGNTMRVLDGALRIPGIGEVRIFEGHQLRRVRQLLKRGGRITKVTVRHDGRHWVGSLLLRAPDFDTRSQHPALPAPGGAAGVDLGLGTFAVVADDLGITRERSPRPYRALERKLKRAQRRASRAQKGSVNAERRWKEVRRIHARIRDTRKTFLHTSSARLAKTHSQVTIETLGVSGLTRTHLAKSVSDAGWGEWGRMVEYKCHRYATVVRRVERWFPSTQTCSGCGEVRGERLTLAERTFTCLPADPGMSCGTVMDRDENSALVLKETESAMVVLPPVFKPPAPRRKRTLAST